MLQANPPFSSAEGVAFHQKAGYRGRSSLGLLRVLRTYRCAFDRTLIHFGLGAAELIGTSCSAEEKSRMLLSSVKARPRRGRAPSRDLGADKAGRSPRPADSSVFHFRTAMAVSLKRSLRN